MTLARWMASTGPATADDAAELGCACVPSAAVKGIWVVYADDDQRDVLEALRQEQGLTPLSWHANRQTEKT